MIEIINENAENNFSKYSLPIVFLRDINEGHLSIEGADNKQSNFTDELKNFDKVMIGLVFDRINLF